MLYFSMCLEYLQSKQFLKEYQGQGRVNIEGWAKQFWALSHRQGEITLVLCRKAIGKKWGISGKLLGQHYGRWLGGIKQAPSAEAQLQGPKQAQRDRRQEGMEGGDPFIMLMLRNSGNICSGSSHSFFTNSLILSTFPGYLVNWELRA